MIWARDASQSCMIVWRSEDLKQEDELSNKSLETVRSRNVQLLSVPVG